MTLYQLGADAPQIDASAFVADTAIVIGKVTLEANSSVWFGATIRGDAPSGGGLLRMPAPRVRA